MVLCSRNLSFIVCEVCQSIQWLITSYDANRDPNELDFLVYRDSRLYRLLLSQDPFDADLLETVRIGLRSSSRRKPECFRRYAYDNNRVLTAGNALWQEGMTLPRNLTGTTGLSPPLGFYLSTSSFSDGCESHFIQKEEVRVWVVCHCPVLNYYRSRAWCISCLNQRGISKQWLPPNAGSFATWGSSSN